MVNKATFDSDFNLVPRSNLPVSLIKGNAGSIQYLVKCFMNNQHQLQTMTHTACAVRRPPRLSENHLDYYVRGELLLESTRGLNCVLFWRRLFLWRLLVSKLFLLLIYSEEAHQSDQWVGWRGLVKPPLKNVPCLCFIIYSLPSLLQSKKEWFAFNFKFKVWFRRRTSHAPNQISQFSACELRRLNKFEATQMN